MRRSTDRILTTHIGSLVRPPDLVEIMRAKESGRPVGINVFADVSTVFGFLRADCSETSSLSG